MPSLSGKVVWVTGAGSGIGRATALALAHEGARVALTGRRLDALEETAALVRAERGTAILAPADVAREDDVARAHQAVVRELGNPDILVNNAGTNVTRRHWSELDPAGLSQVLDVNLKAPFLCTLAVLPAMRARREGLIVHIASLAGTVIFPASGPGYIAAKHGARALSATINAEEGIYGIRSVCINPGEVATPILDTRPAPPSQEERASMIQPEDIAAAAVFAAMMPARTCVADMTILPTDSAHTRADAHRIAQMTARK
jgi:NADP-dependent 3-hydroxy acid dehydrogenase YdfG